MSANLEIEVRPKSALTSATQAIQRLYARAAFTQEVPNPELDVTGKPGEPLKVSTAVTGELAPDGTALLVANEGVAGSAVTVLIETAQGAELARTEAKFPGDTKTGHFVFEVPVETYRSAGEPAIPEETPLFERSGRFTRFDEALPDFSRFRFYVAPIRSETLEDGRTNPQTAAVRELLGLDGEGDVEDFEVKEISSANANPAAATAIGLRDCTLRTDGTFQFSYEIEGDEIGWFWILLGPESYAGYQVDPADAVARQAVIILPPPARRDDEPASGAAGNGSATGGNGTSCVRCSDAPPMDFDEVQVVQNPLEFGDDPGTTCAPFSNPNRILGERPFFTVLRVDQPEIGAESSIKVSRPIVLELAQPLRSSVLSASFLQNDRNTFSAGVSPLASDVAARLSRSARVSLSTDVGSAAVGAAKSVLEAVARPASAFWQNWVLTRTKQRASVSPRNPIEWEGDPAIYQAASVAGGHILEYRVQWRSNGYSLGKIAHTLTLAPRQTRRISKVSWRRRETASRRERTAQRDEVEQTTLSSRDYYDAVQSSLSEWSNGGSRSQTTGVAGGIGFALGPVVVGGGAAHGRASSESWQSGGRRVSASEQQALRDAIRQFGDSLRQLESTVVTEVSQEEDVEGVSEVVRNVNYCHALTVVYHEILRHYRVDTNFAGVRECLFVPFSVTPFDVHKALKWRDKLRQGMLARELRWALDRLDEVATAWVDSDIPAGRRSQHPIDYVSGSAYFQLSIERPRDRAEEETAETYRKMWSAWGPLLGTSLSQILQQLERTDRDREAYFQKEIAPGMAARWANRLKVSVGGTPLDADFTLATSYRFGSTVRVDFTIPVNKRFNRESFKDLKFYSDDSLPVGSVANLTHASFRYFTPHFDTTCESVRTTNDVILPDTGLPDPLGAVMHFELSAWEQQDLRRVIEDAVDQLIVHLNANLVYYHKVIWWLMDRDELFMLLDGFTAPYGRRFENGKWVEDTGRSLASVVEREPMCILGNSLVFRVASGVFLGIDGHESPEQLHNYYFDANFRPQPLRVSLPTDGLYAQALMDPCNACEEHKGSTDWVLADKDPELESLVGLLGSRRAAPENLTPSAMPETLINLQNAPAAPDPTGLAGILQAVTNSNAFRDMAGLAGTQANALGALTQAASLAQGFGQMAVDFQKAKQGTADAKEKLSNIEKAKSSGLIDSAEAQRQSSKVLDSQNMTSPPSTLTAEESLTNALGRAGVSGQPIEVARQTQYGNELVKIGGTPTTPDVQLASFTTDTSAKSATKLPSHIGADGPQKWEALAPIAPRNAATCAGGIKNVGTLLCVHDAETKIGLRDYASRSDATAWVLVHTVSDLIEAIRQRVGTCNLISGLHIEAHGGSSVDGGFRLGDDTDHDGHVEQNEARDFVSTAAQAAKFGALIKNALAPNAFISVASCMSAGQNNAFIKTLQAATGAIVIGTPAACRSGGGWWRGAWWECEKGRVQINKDGSVKTDATEDGEGIWRPF